jgi:YegS/Rv2252/BmrU family lipid kinase
MKMKRRFLFIMNPIAGGGRDLTRIGRIISTILIRNRNCDFEIRVTSKRGEAYEIAKSVVNQDYYAVAAVGGDGTVNEVASALVNSNIRLGIIPVGSGNGLARGLNLPLTLRRAIRSLCTGDTRKIDVGKIEDRYFFATTGLGFDAVIGKLFDEGNLRGPLPYFYIGIREFFTYKPKEYILRFDEQEEKVRALIVAVANTNQFGNGALIAPLAKPDDGLLDICIIKDVNAFNAFKELPKLFTGQLPKSEYYRFFKTQRVEIIREEPAPIHVDGEPVNGGVHLTVEILPGALSVVIPNRSSLEEQLRAHFKEVIGIRQN